MFFGLKPAPRVLIHSLTKVSGKNGICTHFIRGDHLREPVTVRGSGAESGPLLIKDQGSFAVGGSVLKNSGMYDPMKRTPDEQTLHGDHAYVQYQIPADARSIPLVFLHGAGQ